MFITRRGFIKYCSGAAAAIGLTAAQVDNLAHALSAPTGPSVIWLQGAGCSGCSLSFLNHISTAAPKDAGEVLINVINMEYHSSLMASAGQTAVDLAKEVLNTKNFVLIVEGGVPTAFNGAACFVWGDNGHEVTFEDAVKQFGAAADAVVCLGQCASYGGVVAAPPNPTGVQPVSQILGKTTINVAGCPPHPNWTVWTIAQLVLGASIPLDAYGRPTALYSDHIHPTCTLLGKPLATEYGEHGKCMMMLGCRGIWYQSRGGCPSHKWNDGTSFCMESGAPCFGCTNPDYPGNQSFFIDD